MTEILSTTNTPLARSAAKSTAKYVKTLPVEPKSVIWNPSPDELRRYAAAMPNARVTQFNNINVGTRVVSRSKLSTFIATDRPEEHSDQTITRAEYARVAKLQNDYIRTRDMLVVEGYIGNDPEFRVPARLIMEKANANVAAMQAILYYPATAEELESFEPRLTVIYTPNLKAESYPDERVAHSEHITAPILRFRRNAPGRSAGMASREFRALILGNHYRLGWCNRGLLQQNVPVWRS